MRCEDIFEDLMILVTGELDDSKRKLVEKHLEDCPVCALRLEKLRGMDGCLRGGLSHLETAPDVTDAVMSRVITRQIKPVRRIAWGLAACFAVTCLLMLVLKKPEKVKRHGNRPPVIVKMPKTTPIPVAPKKKLEVSKGIQIASEQRAARVAHRKPSPTKLTRLHSVKHAQVEERSTKASPDITLRVELRITGESSSIVVAAGSVEHVIRAELPDKITATPPNP